MDANLALKSTFYAIGCDGYPEALDGNKASLVRARIDREGVGV
jgi:hypothetical protein